MTFKNKWEKAHTQHSLPDGIITSMMQAAYPNDTLQAFEVIAGGCANINIKVQLKDKDPLYLLRIYLREPVAAYREQKIAELLNHAIPVPQIYHIGDYEHLRFAITEFLPGITLRALLLSNRPHQIEPLMKEVGSVLGVLASHTWPESGFFDQDLNIAERIKPDGFYTFIMECLNNDRVKSVVSSPILRQITTVIEQNKAHYPEQQATNLVHGDFDPANILVQKHNDQWRLSGILDWEFSFAGSTLFDVANMLRYSHHMPKSYESAFLEGILASGVILPSNWRQRCHMLNLLSLLDCLTRSDPAMRPNQCADILELIQHIIEQLGKNH